MTISITRLLAASALTFGLSIAASTSFAFETVNTTSNLYSAVQIAKLCTKDFEGGFTGPVGSGSEVSNPNSFQISAMCGFTFPCKAQILFSASKDTLCSSEAKSGLSASVKTADSAPVLTPAAPHFTKTINGITHSYSMHVSGTTLTISQDD